MAECVPPLASSRPRKALAPRLILRLVWPPAGGGGAAAAGEPVVVALEGEWHVPPAALPR